jgi:2-polyprenyl-6-hydroxyphenyl methylase/3-demethylubiquinone-9 3-methyltransferase
VDIEARFMAVLKDHLVHHEPDLHIEMYLDDLERGKHIPEAVYDIVYLKDVLEHVKDYRACLATASRKLRPGGLVYIATTNVCCPIQLEYHGVGPYSWYPRWLKDRIRLYAMAHKPEIISHSPSPALHWFSRRTLQQALREAGFQQTWDLYDLIRSPQDLTRRTRLIYPFLKQAHFLPILRNLIDVFIPGLTMVAKK